MKPVYFTSAADLVVVGHNPEMADYDNPRGEVYAYNAYVIAEDAKGYRLRSPAVTTKRFVQDALAPAEKVAAALNNRLQKLGKLPVGFAAWTEVPPGYGSEAYVESDAEQDLIEWERGLER